MWLVRSKTTHSEHVLDLSDNKLVSLNWKKCHLKLLKTENTSEDITRNNTTLAKRDKLAEIYKQDY